MKPNRSHGFSLIEVTLAMGVFAIAVVALLGVMPLGLSTHRESKETQAATLYIFSIAARLEQAVQLEDAGLVLGEIEFPEPGSLPVTQFLYVDRKDQSLSKEITSSSIFRVRLHLEMPSAADDKMGLAFIEVSWPPLDPDLNQAKPMGSVEAVIALPPGRDP